VFGNRVLRRIFGAKMEEVVGGWRRLHNEEQPNLYVATNNIKVATSRMMIWMRHVARMEQTRNACKILVGKAEGRRPLGRSRRR
jgi:hypothetical protein